MEAHSHADLKSSESCQIGDTDNHANFADNDTSLVEEQNVSVSENLPADLKLSRSPRNGVKCDHVKEEEDTVSLMLQVLECYQNCIHLSSQSIYICLSLENAIQLQEFMRLIFWICVFSNRQCLAFAYHGRHLREFSSAPLVKIKVYSNDNILISP